MSTSEGDNNTEVVRVWLLGGFRVSVGSRTIDEDLWRRRKAAPLVKLVALNPGQTEGVMPQGEREITLRCLAKPTDIDFEGKVRGGAVMEWIERWRPEEGAALELYAKRLMELRKGIQEGVCIHATLRAE